MLGILAPGGLRQENCHKFKVSLGYIVRSYLKTSKIKTMNLKASYMLGNNSTTELYIS